MCQGCRGPYIGQRGVADLGSPMGHLSSEVHGIKLLVLSNDDNILAKPKGYMNFLAFTWVSHGFVQPISNLLFILRDLKIHENI